MFQKGFECGCRSSFTTIFCRPEAYISFHREEGDRRCIEKHSVVTAMVFKGYCWGKIRREKQILLVWIDFWGGKNPHKILRAFVSGRVIFFFQNSNWCNG